MSTYCYVDTILHGATLEIKMRSPDAYVAAPQRLVFYKDRYWRSVMELRVRDRGRWRAAEDVVDARQNRTLPTTEHRLERVRNNAVVLRAPRSDENS